MNLKNHSFHSCQYHIVTSAVCCFDCCIQGRISNLHELPISPGKASDPLTDAEAAMRQVVPSLAPLLPPSGCWLPLLTLSVKTR